MSFIANKSLQTNRGDPIFVRISAPIKEFAIPALYLTVILGLLIFIVGEYFPKVGHDYGFFLPRMLDTHLHHKVNGLGIQWYTPNFGAGTPAYPNPQYLQYSLPQFLMLVINPWSSLMLSLVTYATIGFVCFYLFLRHEMGWISNASALGASFILANGFFVDHAIVGHVGFQHFPLLGAILFLAFNKRVSSLLAGILIGLVTTMIVNQAGFVVIIIFALSLFVTLPLIYLIKPELFTVKVFTTSWIGLLSSVLLSISKVSAVMAFMRFFPRFIADNYGQTYRQGIVGMIKQLMAFNFILTYHILTDGKIAKISLFFQKATGTDYGLWENNISLSPGLILLLLVGFGCVIFGVKKATLHISVGKVIALIFLALAIWFATDMSLAQGWLFALVKPLPVIRSLHANIRFTSAFIFPLAYLGAYVFHEVFRNRKIGNQAMFVLVGGLTTIMLSLYIAIPQDVYNRSYNLKSTLSTYVKVDHGNNFTLKNIANITDIEVFELGNSNLASQDPILGYQGEYFTPNVVPGPIMEVRNGHYNITNPASYVFPIENNLQPFEPFRVNEKAALELFINHKQPNLKISNWQKFADILNLVALIAAFLYLAFEVARGSVRLGQIMFQRENTYKEGMI